MLGDKGPLAIPEIKREKMGTSYDNPNFKPILTLIISMMQDKEMVTTYPLSENARMIVASKEILKVITDPSESNSEFKGMITTMCRDNLKLSKKVAKNHI